MNFVDQENALLDKWAIKRKNLVRDGAADPVAFQNSDRKLLFLLKEPNDPGGGGWDLRQFMRAGAMGPTWNNIARWARVLQQAPEAPRWENLSAISNKERESTLKYIAAVNLKKEPGSGTTDPAILTNYVKQDRELITQQISLYQADLIIGCGYVIEQAIRLIFPECRMQLSNNGFSWCRTPNGSAFISYYHPQSRFPANLLCYGLFDAAKEILEKLESGAIK